MSGLRHRANFSSLMWTGAPAAPPPAPVAARAVEVVVIGAGIAGLAAVESLRTAAPAAAITLVSAEPELPYYRLNLTRYVAGEIAEQDLPIHPAGWYEERNVRLLLGRQGGRHRSGRPSRRVAERGAIALREAAVGDRRTAVCAPLSGADRAGVTTLRTVADARALVAACHAGARICIGGGLLGLETAGGLARRGADVTLLEGSGWLLPRQLNQRAGDPRRLCRGHRDQAAHQRRDVRDRRRPARPRRSLGGRRHPRSRSGRDRHRHSFQ